MNFFLREAWHEMRCGLRGGVIPLVYVALTGYLLMVITSADNLRSLGAVDVPRNAPALVYLMTAGMAFFLFFAWAWVFAQPVVRDRHAQLHELVLSAPCSLRQLLLARYLGALGVALVLGTAQFLGFWLAPALETMGAIPPGSVAAPPGWPSAGPGWSSRCRWRRVAAPCTTPWPSTPAARPGPSRYRPCSWASGWWP